MYASAGSFLDEEFVLDVEGIEEAAAISSNGPSAMRLATRKLSSIVRSAAALTVGASGAIRPRLRT